MQLNIEQICSEKIIISNYQREYKWRESLVKGLVETCGNKDYLEIDEISGEPYGLLGHLTVSARKDFDENENEIRVISVIDGQQRITTLKLIEAAINSIENVPTEKIIKQLELLIVHHNQREEYNYFKDFLLGLVPLKSFNIYIKNFNTIKSELQKQKLQNYKSVFYKITFDIKFRRKEWESSSFFMLNNDLEALQLKEKANSLFLEKEIRDDLIGDNNKIDKEIEIIGLKEERYYRKFLIDFLMIEHFETFSKTMIDSYAPNDSLITNVLKNIIKTKEDSKRFQKDFAFYLDCFKIGFTQELRNYIGNKLYNKIDIYEINKATLNPMIALILYNLRKKHPDNRTQLNIEISKILEDVIIPFFFNNHLTNYNPLRNFNFNGYKPLYKDYNVIVKQDKKTIYDLFVFFLKIKHMNSNNTTKWNRLTKNEFIKNISNMSLIYQKKDSSFIRRNLSLLFEVNNNDKACTLEHIIPQSYSYLVGNLNKQEWEELYNSKKKNPNTYIDIPYEQIEDIIYSIGNFALLDNRLNSKLGNKNPREKAILILQNTEGPNSNLSITHSDAKEIEQGRLNVNFINKRKEVLRKIIIDYVKKQPDFSQKYIDSFSCYLDNKKQNNNNSIKEDFKSSIRESIEFNIDIFLNIAEEYLENNFKKGIFEFNLETLLDELKLHKKYNMLRKKVIELKEENYFNREFDIKIKKQLTWEQCYLKLATRLNNKGYKLRITTGKPLLENKKINNSSSSTKQLKSIIKLNEIIEGQGEKNSIVIIERKNN